MSRYISLYRYIAAALVHMCVFYRTYAEMDHHTFCHLAINRLINVLVSDDEVMWSIYTAAR